MGRAGPESIGAEVREGREPVQGTVRQKPVALRLGSAGDELGHAVDFGLPPPQDDPPTLFQRDPQIKREPVWAGPVLRPAARLTEWHGQVVTWRDATDVWVDSGRRLAPQDSILAEVADASAAPEDLLWTAALLSPRPPQLFVLNEPETSLHPDLLPPLAHLVAEAAGRTQTLVVTHSTAVREALDAAYAGDDRQDVHLVKDAGETVVDGQGRLDAPPWHWPGR